MEELGRLYESDTPVPAYDFKRRMVEGWTPEHNHHRGQLVALTQGLLIVERENERWLFPSRRCAWTPPNCKHAARSVGGAAGSMVGVSPEMCRGLPKTPRVFNSSQLLFAIVHRMVGWGLRQPLDSAKKHLIATLRDEIRQPERQSLRLTIPREERLARVAEALLEDVGGCWRGPHAGRLGASCWNGAPYFYACVFCSGRHVIWPLATAGALVCCP